MPAGPAGCSETDAGAVGLGAAYGFADTDLIFAGETFEAQQHLAVGTVAYHLDRRWTLRASAGAVLGGELRRPGTGQRWRLLAGPAVSLGAAVQALPDNDANLILSLSLSLGMTVTKTRQLGSQAPSGTQSYTALDLRFGVLFGAILFERWTPFLLARAFGGPVFWSPDGTDVTGTDATHVQLGLGSALTLTPWLSLFVEGSLFGERGVAAGIEVTL